jgi:hypothetical protein
LRPDPDANFLAFVDEEGFAITLKFASAAVADQIAVLARTGASIVLQPISALPPSKLTVGLDRQL